MFLSNMHNDTKEIMKLAVEKYPNHYISTPYSPLHNNPNYYSIYQRRSDDATDFWNYFEKLKKYLLYKKFIKNGEFHVVKFDSKDSVKGTTIFKTDNYNWEDADEYYVGYRTDSWCKEDFKPLTIEDIKLLESNLTEKEKEPMTKYKLIKPLSGKLIIANNGCEDETIKFINKFGLKKEIEWTKENEDYCLKQDGWIRFFVDKRFIEENKIEVDKDKLYFWKFDENTVVILNKRSFEKWTWDRILNTSRSNVDTNDTVFCNDIFSSMESAIYYAENHYKTSSVDKFDSTIEAINFHFPEEKKEQTKEEDFKEMKKLCEKYNIEIDCGDSGLEDECDGIPCRECPAGIR